jgi:hypothetical protein
MRHRSAPTNLGRFSRTAGTAAFERSTDRSLPTSIRSAKIPCKTHPTKFQYAKGFEKLHIGPRRGKGSDHSILGHFTERVIRADAGYDPSSVRCADDRVQRLLRECPIGSLPSVRVWDR